MRKIILSTLMLGTSMAVVADDHYYGGFELGATHGLETTFENNITGLDLNDEKRLGVMGGLYLGRAIGKWRIEGEYAIRNNYLKSFDVTNAGDTGLATGEINAGGKRKSSAIMANAWYQVAGNDDWKIFAGLGLGFADLELNRERSGQNVLVDGNGWQGAGQAMVQFVKELEGGLEIGAGVRHFRAFSKTFVSDVGTFDIPFKNNEIFARLSWKFGGEAPKAAPALAPTPYVAPKPAPQPAPVVTPDVEETPAPAPEPVPLPGPFMVFFDFDQSTITPEAADIIKAAAQAFKSGKAVTVVVTGHADRAGPDAYNMKLAQRRADAVQAALAAEGVATNQITSKSKGESSPLVPTADGVREPQNRRAEIVLGR